MNLNKLRYVLDIISIMMIPICILIVLYQAKLHDNALMRAHNQCRIARRKDETE